MDNRLLIASKRTGEKVGWIGGWSGAFIWVVVLAVVRLAQGAVLEGLIGIVVTASAFATIFIVRPWKRPDAPMWKLMVPLYAFLVLSILWTVWAWGGFTHPDMQWWMFPWLLFWIFPCLTPLWLIGGRRWNDANNSGSSELGRESKGESEQ